jgi:hypothetical protein
MQYRTRFRRVSARLGLTGLVLAALAIPFGPAAAQDTAQDAGLSAALQAMQQDTESALEASRQAEQARTVADVKSGADAVFAFIWGLPSGLAAEDAEGAEQAHGWKTQWQVSYDDFDEAFAERYGNAPPEITDPARLGILGRGRHVRKLLQAAADDAQAAAEARHAAEATIIALNNVIGWMQIDDGVTKSERQPRVDLTRAWDAPSEFWLSTADTGWLFEAYAQALNILKTDYEGDVRTARTHAAGLTTLLEKCLQGLDADADGTVEPVMMEGGLQTALAQAQSGGLLDD